MKRMASLLLVLLFAVPAVGEAPKLVLKGPTKIKAGTPIIVSGKKSTGVRSCEWTVVGHDEIVVMTLDDRDLVAYVVFDEPGTYELTLTAMGDPPVFVGEKKVKNAWNDAYIAWLEDHFCKPSTDEAEATLTITVEGSSAANPYQAPSPNVRTWVEPLSKFKLQRADALSLAAMYQSASLASLATTADLRAFCVGEGSKLGLKAKYDGLANAVELAWNDSIGLKVRPLTPQDKAVMAGLAWAIWQAGNK